MVQPAYFICYSFSIAANGVDELAGTDNMESEEVNGNRGLALAATSKNGKHACAYGLVHTSFRLHHLQNKFLFVLSIIRA